MLMFSPVHLRIAPSEGYLLVELYLMLSFVGMELWFATQRKSVLQWSLATRVCQPCVACGPVRPMLFVCVLVARERLTWTVRRLAQVGWFGLILGTAWFLRFAIALTNPDSPVLAQVHHLPVIGGFILVGSAFALLGGRLASVLESRRKRMVTWTHGLVLGLAASVGLWLAPWRFNGDWPAFVEPFYGVFRIFPLLHPTLVSPLLGGLVVLGVMRFGMHSPWKPMVMLGVQAFVTVVHFVLIGEDSLSYFLRSGMLMLWAWTAIGAYVLADFVHAERHRPAIRTACVLCLVVGLGSAPYWRVIQYWYPSQQEGRLLVETLPTTGLNEGMSVVGLMEEDTPFANMDGVMWVPNNWRGQLERQHPIKGERYVSVTKALSSPEEVIGGIWFRSLSCFRTGLVEFEEPPNAAVRKGKRYVFGAGRLWEMPNRLVPNGGVNLPVFGPKVRWSTCPVLHAPRW